MKIKAMSWATKAVIIVTVIITIVAELSKPLKDFLASLTGHHWVTKGVLALAIFILLTLILGKDKKNVDVWKEARNIAWITLIALFVLFAFFLWEFLKG